MHPSFDITLLGASLTLPAYLTLRFLYFPLAAWLAVVLNARQGIAARDTLIVFVLGVPAGLLGAYALAWIETGGVGEMGFAGWLEFWRGRSAIFGGLAAGVATAAVCARWRGIALRRFLDACAPVMALGEAMSRTGCLLAGCCHGKVTDSFAGMVFPRRSVAFTMQVEEGLIPFYGSEGTLPIHPTQLYSLVFALALTLVLLVLFLRARGFDGRLFCLFLFAYGAWRLVLFPFRADPGDFVLLGLYASQLWSLVAIGVSLGLAARWRRTAGEALPVAVAGRDPSPA